MKHFLMGLAGGLVGATLVIGLTAPKEPTDSYDQQIENHRQQWELERWQEDIEGDLDSLKQRQHYHMHGGVTQ